MSLVRRQPKRSRQVAAEPIRDLAFGLDAGSPHRAAFESTDEIAHPILERLRLRGTPLDRVHADTGRSTADLRFADGAAIRVATTGEAILQLCAAARLADMRRVLHRRRVDAPGRVLVLTSTQWTIYLVVDAALAL